MPSSDPITSVTTWYHLILIQYHQVPTITVLYTASAPHNAQLSQLDLVSIVFSKYLCMIYKFTIIYNNSGGFSF